MVESIRLGSRLSVGGLLQYLFGHQELGASCRRLRIHRG